MAASLPATSGATAPGSTCTADGTHCSWKRGMLTARAMSCPPSTTARIASSVMVGMREPPGLPITIATRPFLDRMVGDIEDSGVLPGAIALASAPSRPHMLAEPALAEKSSISSLSTMPVPSATTCAPK